METPTYTSPLANYYAQFGGGNPASATVPGNPQNVWVPNIDKDGNPAPGGGHFGIAGAEPKDIGAVWSPGMQASERQFAPGSEGWGIATYGILDQARASNQALFASQEGLIAQAGQERVAGIDRALGETERLAQAGYQRARDFATNATAAADLGAMESGLYSSTERLNAQRAVQGDVFRRFLDVDSAYAGTRAQLQAQRGQAAGAALDSLANFYERVRSTNESSYLYEFDARLGRGTPQEQQGQDGGNGWASALATIATILIAL